MMAMRSCPATCANTPAAVSTPSKQSTHTINTCHSFVQMGIASDAGARALTTARQVQQHACKTSSVNKSPGNEGFWGSEIVERTSVMRR